MIFTGIRRIGASVREGNLQDRGRAEMVVGDWRRLIEDINSIIDVQVGQIQFMGRNIGDISKGNIPEKITDEFKGDYNEIKNNLNICFASIDALIVDMNMLSASALEGNLSKRADAAKHQGDFRKIVEGVNATLDHNLSPNTRRSRRFRRNGDW